MGVETLAGRRVSLRPIQEGDLFAADAWYEEAARAAYEGRSLQELRTQAAGDGTVMLAVVRPDEGEAIGLLDYQVKRNWLTVAFIALAKAYRGWGYGSEAVRLLEEWALLERLAERFRAEVDVRNGLGLYFWLRLGYRPGASAGDGRDVMTMVREIETGES